jgi:UDP-N-acetylmuramoyl-L-alanyl-D-glutamate--2,6-diaminopimelate ligase
MTALAELLAALDAPRTVGAPPTEIAALAVDSRAVAPGALFVAVRGERVDGHDFAADAVARGAAAVVAERELPVRVPQILVADTRRAISRLAAAYYDRPSQAMLVVGITGTNGKTTTSYFVRSICAAGGIPCGVIGTLGAAFGEASWELENTTPLALDLQRVLAELRAAGAHAVAMEVSSHALALDRVDDVRFAVAALTNVTRDHLDFHGTHERYVAAKRRLFALAPAAVLNVDDAVGRALADELSAVTTYALERDAELRPQQLELRADGSSFAVGGARVELALPGRFNVANALAAWGVGRRIGLDEHTIARGLAALERVPGRMERFGGGGVSAIVDYAHTPDALANVLRAAREAARGRLIVVFGCGGDRDRGKRAEMGRIAAALADRPIVTSDNPRSEDPAAIAREVAGDTGAQTILDRRDAIRTAIAAARPGDTVVVAGKGHETYQIVGADRRHFDDREEVRAALEARK